MMRAWVLVLGLVACAPRGTPGQGMEPSQLRYPGELVAVSELAGRGDFLARQTLVGRLGEREIHGHVVLQKRGSELTLIGLTPFGSKAFVIQQDARGVRSQTIMTGALPSPPEFMLLDVHRALFMGLSPRPGADGERRGTRAGEKIVETWQGGRLLTRTFKRRDRRPKGTITIEYVGGMAGEQAPARIVVDNGWFGYKVEISTVSWQAL